MATRNLLHAPTSSHIGAEGAARQESVKCAGSAGRRAALISASSPTRRKRMTDRLVPVPFLERPNSSVRLIICQLICQRGPTQRAADAKDRAGQAKDLSIKSAFKHVASDWAALAELKRSGSTGRGFHYATKKAARHIPGGPS